MALTILTPKNSFIRFDGQSGVTHCLHGDFNECLPVYEDADISFQFVVMADTPEEADELCQVGESGLEIGLVSDCLKEDFDIDFDEQPERYRISPQQVLYNWPHGLPGMVGFYDPGQCFFIRINIGEVTECSNCFQRIADDCFTSVIEYGNNENFAGFNYCNAGAVVDPETISCEPTVIQFVNKSTLMIPYTASLQAMYGEVPTVQVWIDDGSGGLVNMGITAVFDNYPPQVISFDFGGPATGIIILR